MMPSPDRQNGGPPRDPNGRPPTAPQGPGQPPGNGGPMPTFNGTTLIWIVMAGLLALWLVFYIWGTPNFGNNGDTINYSAFVADAQSGRLCSTVTLQDDKATGTLGRGPAAAPCKSTAKFNTVIPTPNTDTVTLLSNNKVPFEIKPSSSNGPGATILGVLVNLLPIILLVGIIWWFTRRSAGSQQNLFSFGQSRARLYNAGNKTRITFADVAGVEEAKVDLEEIVDYLRNPDRYQRLGGKIPHGMLLVGPPGTGKTLLAKAVAGEADVPFFSMSGSEFVEMLVGVGASRVRDLFEKAKKNAPCIIFVDELDAVGRQRGAGLGGGNDEREQTLNQILVEMDGFDSHQAIVVLGATNRPDVLDPALLRPGRFDRRVVVDRPDRPGREAILAVHSRELPLADDVILNTIARNTPGMVGADLANLCNEAALLAARRNQDKVTMQCFEDALDRIMIGALRPLVLSENDRKITAYHEAGHAIMAMLTPGGDPVHKVTIVPRGQALGVTQFMPAEDRHNASRSFLMSRIAYGLGGRVAEETALGDVTSGAENDFQQVTNIAREMVTRWGMSSKVGPVFYGTDREVFLGREMSLGQQREYSEHIAGIIDEEVREIIEERFAYVKNTLIEHRDLLDNVSAALLERETLDSKELQEILEATIPQREVTISR